MYLFCCSSGTYRGSWYQYRPSEWFAWLSYVQCTGDENNLFDCTHSGSRQCAHQARISCGKCKHFMLNSLITHSPDLFRLSQPSRSCFSFQGRHAGDSCKMMSNCLCFQYISLYAFFVRDVFKLKIVNYQ